MPVQYVENYISTAPNTATSLSRTLAYMDKGRNIKSSMNVMTLAKQAGYTPSGFQIRALLAKMIPQCLKSVFMLSISCF
jgi:hypothetical protein